MPSPRGLFEEFEVKPDQLRTDLDDTDSVSGEGGVGDNLGKL